MLDRLTLERVAALGEGPLLVAFSGGGDSTALLGLLVDALGASRLHAGIVDHSLRVGSERDAARAETIARAHGVAAEVLTLTWPDGPKSAQSAARRGRYAALCGIARNIGARVMVTAHTRDDLAETVFMRGARGSGWRGLAGMRPLTSPPVWPEGRGLVLARPLLGARRQELRDWLKRRNGVWIEDPANTNEAFQRVRARHRLAELSAHGFDPMRLAVLAERLAAHAIALDDAAFELIERTAHYAADRIELAERFWLGPVSVRQRALQALIAAAGGQEAEPPAEQVATLERAAGGADFTAATLAGAELRRKREVLVLSRDKGALIGRSGGGSPMPAMALKPGHPMVWDGRAVVTADEPGWAVVAEGGEPRLTSGGEDVPLAEAGVEWLLRARVQHVLGRC